MLRSTLTVTALTTLLGAAPVLAQTTPAGVVTAVHGTANIARASTNQTNPLRFKDDVFLFDRITTGERSLARILLGGRAVVTARERSILTITAVPGSATLGLESGRLLLAVAKGTLGPGESIDIKTRNAVIGIRGTVVVADFVPGQSRDGSGDSTVFTILRGAVEVTQIDPLAARAVGAPLQLGALQSVTVMGTRFPEVKTITAEQAKRLTQGFSIPIRLTPETNKDVADMHSAQVERELSALLAPVTNAGNATSTNGTTSGNSGPVTAATGTVSSVTSTVSGTTAPVTGTLSGIPGAVSGITTPVVGAVSGIAAPGTGTLTGTPVPTQLAAPTPPPASAASTPRNNGGLVGGLLKTTGSLLK